MTGRASEHVTSQPLREVCDIKSNVLRAADETQSIFITTPTTQYLCHFLLKDPHLLSPIISLILPRQLLTRISYRVKFMTGIASLSILTIIRPRRPTAMSKSFMPAFSACKSTLGNVEACFFSNSIYSILKTSVVVIVVYQVRDLHVN